MQHRLMILGSMDEFVDLVTLARSKGMYTIVCDGYEQGPAKQYANKVYNIDVRETDKIAEICVAENVDGIIASFSDLLAESLVAIADKAGLPCYAKPERFKYLREKPLMKQMLREIGANAPEAVCIDRQTLENDPPQLSFPCVIKPTSGYGSRGVYVVESIDEIVELYDDVVSYSNTDTIIIERYCQGHEFNMTTWVLDGKVLPISIADRETSTEVPRAIPHVSRCAYPSRMLDQVLDEATQVVQKVADFVGIETGPLSMQFFYEEPYGVLVCEVAGRLFGYEHELVTLSCGLSMEELLLDQTYDHDSLHKHLKDHTPYLPSFSAGLYFHGYEGEVCDVSALLDAANDPRVVNTTLYYKPGEVISHSAGMKPYVARCYLKAASRESLDEITAELFEKVRVLDPQGRNLLYSNQMASYC